MSAEVLQEILDRFRTKTYMEPHYLGVSPLSFKTRQHRCGYYQPGPEDMDEAERLAGEIRDAYPQEDLRIEISTCEEWVFLDIDYGLSGS